MKKAMHLVLGVEEKNFEERGEKIKVDPRRGIKFSEDLQGSFYQIPIQDHELFQTLFQFFLERHQKPEGKTSREKSETSGSLIEEPEKCGCRIF